MVENLRNNILLINTYNKHRYCWGIEPFENVRSDRSYIFAVKTCQFSIRRRDNILIRG